MQCLANLSAERLRELLHYDETSGIFTWKRHKYKSFIGRISGNNHEGYVRITIDGSTYYAHRLAWLYVHGSWPSATIDHWDLDKSNNAINNLRDATHSQNCANVGTKSGNKSGYKGVSKQPNGCGWFARIRHNRKSIYLGNHKTAEEAHEAYKSAAAEIYGDFSRYKSP